MSNWKYGLGVGKDERNRMAKIKFYVISCSAMGDMDVRKLYVWGEWHHNTWLPKTEHEARKRIKLCRKKYCCEACDAEVHKVVVERTKKTSKQL